jgi:hypothetical protein
VFSQYPDPTVLPQILRAIRYGLHLGYSGPRFRLLGPNNKSALDNPEPILANLATEIQAGRTFGPFSVPPFPNFRSSPLGTAPKPNGKFRRTHDLSWPHDSSSRSVNSSINKDQFDLAYSSVDDVIDEIIRLGPGCLLSKSDLDAAFRHCLVRPEDWELLGFSWNGQYYYDAFLPFGLRSSPFLYNIFAELLHWAGLLALIAFIRHYVDDFIFVEPNISTPTALATFIPVATVLGFSINPDKNEGPCTALSFTGIHLNTASMIASLPVSKLEECRRKVNLLYNCRSCTKRSLLSLIGSLAHAAKVLRPGRAFLRRFIDAAHSVRRLSHFVPLSSSLYEDLAWWAHFLPLWNGASFMNWHPWTAASSIGLHFATDASGSIGHGVVYGPSWLHERWSDPGGSFVGLHPDPTSATIQWKELYAVIIAAATFGHLWVNQRIRVLVDNQNVHAWLNNSACRDPLCLHLLRLLSILSAQHHFLIRADWLSSRSNAIADALSRFDLLQFRALLPDASPTPTPVGTVPTGTFREMWRISSSTALPNPLVPLTPPLSGSS